MRIDGTGLTRLTATENIAEADPAWSHQGHRTAFVAYEPAVGRFVLKTMAPDGSDMATVYDPVDAVATPAFRAGVHDPSWSPDDAWIVFDKPVRSHGENGGPGSGTSARSGRTAANSWT